MSCECENCDCGNTSEAIEQGFCRLSISIAIPAMIIAVSYWVDVFYYIFWE